MSGKNKITIALISLVGVIVAALLTNWDKIFPPKDTMQFTYTGYRPTGKFDTEFRYFIDISGTRDAVTMTQSNIVNLLRNNLLSQYPNRDKEINSMADTVLKESLTIDEVLQKFLPVYKKHFTVEEIQELNKFYSSEIMQDMVKKKAYD